MARKAGRRVDRALLARVGRKALLERAVLCPCQREDGAQDVLCTACDERGYLYEDSLVIKALFTSDSREESFDMQSAWEKGSAVATIAAHIEVSHQDRLIVQELPVRGESTLIRAESGLTDPLPSPHITELLRARSISTSFAVGADCHLSVDASTGVGSVVWQPGASAPAAGERYTVQFKRKPSWIVAAHPKARGFGGKARHQLPWRCELVREDRALRAQGQ